MHTTSMRVLGSHTCTQREEMSG
uniref:Uncharacterized protein n=1 Tax=Anguilla anguilla TaxID=7936 RepID=A0A0E9URU3_ANGAN